MRMRLEPESNEKKKKIDENERKKKKKENNIYNKYDGAASNQCTHCSHHMNEKHNVLFWYSYNLFYVPDTLDSDRSKQRSEVLAEPARRMNVQVVYGSKEIRILY